MIGMSSSNASRMIMIVVEGIRSSISIAVTTNTMMLIVIAMR